MNLSVTISGQKPNEVKVSIKQLPAGHHTDTPESRALHKQVVEYLEPAVYEAVKAMVDRRQLTRATVLWDGVTFSLKANEIKEESTIGSA